MLGWFETELFMEAFPGMGNDLSKGKEFGQRLFIKHVTGDVCSTEDVTEEKEEHLPSVRLGRP